MSDDPIPVAAAGVPPSDEARPDRYLIFALLSLSLLLFIMQFAMVSVSLQQLTDDLDAPLRWSGWVLTIFMVGQVVAMPVAGRLSERFGPRAVFAGGFGLFGLASLVCALTPNIYVLIAARAMQGLAGGGMMPAGISLIGESFGAQRTRAIGFFTSIMPMGAVLGPPVGGLIVDHAGWRWTFGFNVPVGIGVCLVAFVLLPVGARRPVQRLDFGGIGLLVACIVSFIYALTELGLRDQSPNLAVVAISLAISAVAGVALVWHERRTPVPIVDLDLLSRREFLFANAISFLFGAAWIGVASMVPLYAQEGYGLSSGASGAIMSPRAFIMAGTATIAAFFLPRTGARWPIAIGVVGLGMTLAVLSRGIHSPEVLGMELSNLSWLIVVVGSAGLAFGISNPALQNVGLDLAPDRIAGVAGLRGMFQQLGGTIGIAVTVMIASRGETTASGLEQAFLIFAFVVTAAVFLVPWLPEIGGRPDRQGHRPVDVAAAADSGQRQPSVPG